MRACTVDIDTLRTRITTYLDNDLGALVSKDATEAQPTTGFQRVIHRAVVHVQSSGREEVTGANVLVAIFAERESHAAYFLQEQEMTRFDAVQYISHGIAKRPGMTEPRHVRGVDEDQARRGRGEKARPGRAQHLLRQPQQEGARRQDRSADRPREGGAAHHPGALPAPEEQSAVRRRPRRRQDGDRGRPRAQDHQGRGARGAAGRHHLRARHGRAAGRHALPRRLRGAAQGGDEGDRELSGLDPVHRRDPHRDRRRRDLRRRHGCVQPAEAGAAVGHRALHRLDDLQGVPAALREGPRARAALPEDRREGAYGRGHHRDPQGPEALFRGASTSSSTPPTPSRRRSSSRPSTSTTASCPTRRST